MSDKKTIPLQKTAKTITISLAEKLILPDLLPQEGSYQHMIARRDLLKKLEITQSDVKTFDIKAEPLQDGSNKVVFKFNEAGSKHSEKLPLTELESNMLKTRFTELDAQKKLPGFLIDLYEAICVR